MHNWETGVGEDLMNLLRHAIILFCLVSTAVSAGPVFQLGLKIQKVPNLYVENGLVFTYHSNSLLNNKLYLSVGFVSSRFGSALGSNALKQEEYQLSASYVFREARLISPYLRLNTGYFVVDTEVDIFSDLPNSSLLLSAELGFDYQLNGPMSLSAGTGFNLITGNGIKGPGTLYPVYLNLVINYRLTGGLFK